MFHLLHITDPHLFADPAAEHRGVITAESLSAVIASALSQHTPDAILISGDLCQDESREGYQLLKRLVRHLEMPVFCLPGNHDDLALMQEILPGSSVHVLGSHQLSHWKLLATNSAVAGKVHGHFGAQRLADINEQLTALKPHPTLVALHHPPVACGSAWLDGSRLQDADAFFEMLSVHGHVKAVLCGHIHQPLDINIARGGANLRVLATPSTCKQFAVNSDAFATDDKAPGWRWLTLGETDLETSVHRLVENHG